ncbi:uroporphyrinogen decarboxylase family protein [Geomesophilobacter sediminis]|uniref:Uroporphyrinogen decarboxylase family protein n=1 Tax=Geomesophilobacter sediminis TaxID=2798584 RepID=A0A8J7JKS5_9BACT|nr:uroporphyrinogen decarboxylase family protein [Geomesophilobacter sediminis]MBJ6724145.1 uroporphyrinogen decarboxylase family protein [Geomesophilobacter sediminis]
MMTSLQRIAAALACREPDRVPFFLLPILHGARELGLTIREYFSRPRHVVEGQLRLRRKYGHDCLTAFTYAALEVEAWGGEVIFRDDGPPNAGAPIIRSADAIGQLVPPEVGRTDCLLQGLETLRMLKEAAGDEVPVIGSVIAPFSLPVMQLGFEAYLDLIYDRPDAFARLMALNEEFCVAWANAQLAAGASSITYVDPVGSPTIVPRELYLRTGLPIAQRTLARIRGTTAISFASGRCLGIIDDVATTGAAAVSVSTDEELGAVKRACRGRLAVVGNLNGIAMRSWSEADAGRAVKRAIASAGPGGGFILSDNHGEIPWQVPESVLLSISHAVHTWGNYPLTWTQTDE